jgi:hypothetical protein
VQAGLRPITRGKPIVKTKTTVALLLMTALFAATGCSGPRPEFYWYQPDKTLEEVKTAYAECESKAREDAARAVEEQYFDRLRSPVDLMDADNPPSRRNRSADPALEAKARWGDLYRQNAFNGCMQSRGYVKLRAHQVPSNIRTRQLPMGAIAGK